MSFSNKPQATAVNQSQDARQEEPLMANAARNDAAASHAVPGGLQLGAGVEFEGKLRFQGTVRIDARFKGSVITDDVLVVGEHARMDADITCGTVIVEGQVNGNILAQAGVELRRTARVRGDVIAPSLVMEKGALLQGGVTMDQDRPAANSPSSR